MNKVNLYFSYLKYRSNGNDVWEDGLIKDIHGFEVEKAKKFVMDAFPRTFYRFGVERTDSKEDVPDKVDSVTELKSAIRKIINITDKLTNDVRSVFELITSEKDKKQ